MEERSSPKGCIGCHRTGISTPVACNWSACPRRTSHPTRDQPGWAVPAQSDPAPPCMGCTRCTGCGSWAAPTPAGPSLPPASPVSCLCYQFKLSYLREEEHDDGYLRTGEWRLVEAAHREKKMEKHYKEAGSEDGLISHPAHHRSLTMSPSNVCAPVERERDGSAGSTEE